LSLWPWQTAVKAVFLDRVDIVENYEREVHSADADDADAEVIALRQYVKPSSHPAFTRFNLFLRDASLPILRVGQGSDLRPCHPARGRADARPGKMSRPPARRATCARAAARRNRRICRSIASRGARRAGSCRTMAAPSRPTISTTSWRDWLYWDVELEA
jgi:hypothetical protein